MIGIVDFQAGNISSVQNALTRLDANFFISDQIESLEKA